LSAEKAPNVGFHLEKKNLSAEFHETSLYVGGRITSQDSCPWQCGLQNLLRNQQNIFISRKENLG